MRSAEEAAFAAVLDGDEDEAARLIADMLPNERAAIHAAAIKLATLAGGLPSLPDALSIRAKALTEAIEALPFGSIHAANAIRAIK